MQFYQQRYPRVVKIQKQDRGLVVAEDIHSGDAFGFDHSMFSTMYEKLSLAKTLEQMRLGEHSTSLEEIHDSLCKKQGTTMLDRAVLVVVLLLSVLVLFAGVRDSRLLRVLFILVRLSAAHGTSLSRVIIDQQIVGGTDA